MNKYPLRHVALKLMPELQALYSARKQARYQYLTAAGEYKGMWEDVIDTQDTRIGILELQVSGQLGVNRYIGKKEIVP